MKVGKENVEDLILLYIDQELDAATTAALLLFLENNPQYKTLLADYQDTVLQPEKLVYGNKSALLRHEKIEPKRVPFFKVQYAAAAVAMAALGASIFYFSNTPTIEKELVKQSVQIKQPAAQNANTTVAQATQNTSGKSVSQIPIKKKKEANAQHNKLKSPTQTPPETLAVLPIEKPQEAHKANEDIHLPMPVPQQQDIALAVEEKNNILPQVEQPKIVDEAIANSTSETRKLPKGLLGDVIRVGSKIFNNEMPTINIAIGTKNPKEYIIRFN